MADSFSMKAILSAQDRNFSSTFEKAASAAAGIESKIKSGLGFGVLAGIGSQAFSAITSGISGMVSELSASSAAWKTFEGNMSMLGKSADEIAGVKKELSDFATQTIYSASDMASTYSQLAAVGIKSTDKLVKGFGGLAAAAENPTQAMKTLSQQATQMAAKPMVQWQDFKLMLEQTPAGIAAVAKEMGKTTQQLVQDVQDGTVATEDFFDAIAKVGTNDAFTKLATQYKTVGQAMDGLKETVSVQLAPAFDVLSQSAINGIQGIIDKVGEINPDDLASKIQMGIDRIKGIFDAFASTGAVSALQTAFTNIGNAIGHVFDVITSNGGALQALAGILGNVVTALSNAASAAANFINSMPPGVINAIASAIIGAALAFQSFKVVNKVKSLISGFTGSVKNALDGVEGTVTKSGSTVTKVFNGIGKVIGSAGKAISTAAKGIGTGIKTAFQGITPAIKALGTAVASAAKGIGTGLATALKGLGSALAIANPVAILAVGAAIGIVVAALALLSTQGEGASKIIASIGTAFGNLAPLISATGEAISSVVNSIGTAISNIVTALTPIAQIIGDVFVQVAQVVADAVVRIVQAIAPFAPSMTEMAQAVSTAVQSIANAFSTLFSNLSPTIDSIANLITNLGDAISTVLQGVGDVVADIGSAISNVISGIGDAISGVLDSLAGIIDSIGNSALKAGEGFQKLADGISTITGLGLLDMGTSLTAVAAGIAEISLASRGLETAGAAIRNLATGLMLMIQSGQSASMALSALANAITPLVGVLPTLPPALMQASATLQTFSAGVVTAMAGLTASVSGITAFATALTILRTSFSSVSVSSQTLVTAMLLVASALKTVSDSANYTGNALQSLSSGINSVGSSLNSLGSIGVSAMNQLINALRSAESQAQSAGRAIGNNFKTEVQNGLNEVPKIAQQAMNGFTQAVNAGGNQAVAAANSMAASIRSALASASNGAYSSGYQIGAGLASGMYSSLGAVRAAANALVAEANRAIQAKAQIHSPARLFMPSGAYMTEGVGVGMESRFSWLRKVAQKMVQIPDLPNFNLNHMGSVRLHDDYDYRPVVYVRAEVTSIMDNREVGYGTAEYVQEKNEFEEKRRTRLKGGTA